MTRKLYRTKGEKHTCISLYDFFSSSLTEKNKPSFLFIFLHSNLLEILFNDNLILTIRCLVLIIPYKAEYCFKQGSNLKYCLANKIRNFSHLDRKLCLF